MTHTPLRAAPQASALDDIVDYINDRMRWLASGTAEPGFSAQSAELRVRSGAVEARVGPFVLTSAPRALLTPDAATPVARLAHIVVHLASGRRVAPDILFRLQGTPSAVVAMDRLCRVVHMLQHLEHGREEEDLWLHVSLRHALAVEQGHGQFFESLLRRCGLGAERIVLVLPVLDVDDVGFERYATAAANYRAAGYRLALDLRQAWHPGERAALARLAPDWLRVHGRELPLLADAPPLLVRGLQAPTAVIDGRRALLESPRPLLPRFMF